MSPVTYELLGNLSTFDEEMAAFRDKNPKERIAKNEIFVIGNVKT